LLLLVPVSLLVVWVILSLSSFSPPTFQQVRNSYNGSEAVLLDRHGKVIHELRIDAKKRRLKWVDLKEISPALQSAVLYAEDKGFYQHRGVDWQALGGALIGRLSTDRLRGASTISMQLASKLRPELQPETSHRSLWQKWKQIRAASKLEESWSKAQVLEAYLNLVTFRGELQGIASASRGLFDKRPHGLDDSESVILASLLRAPGAPIEQVGDRACRLSSAMHLPLSREAILFKTQNALSSPCKIEPEMALAPHVCRQLVASRFNATLVQPQQMTCTLDSGLQRWAMESLRQHLLALQGQNVHDGAVLVADNATGEILAYVGNNGDQASARFVDGTQARRQAGSILKPFLYGLAIDTRLLTTASLLDDAPLDVSAPNGIYRPENYDRQFHGRVTARTALASSLNIPAVKVLGLLGVETFVRKLRDLGFDNLQSPDFYGASLALGSADVTLWELVNAYRSLANRGVWSPMHLTFEPKPESIQRRIFSAESVFIVSDVLSDRESRSETFSLESPLATRFWTAVKTGTSKDMRDNWCVGFSKRYTVGVWTGNFSGEPMWNVSGISGAAPIWLQIMNWLHRDVPSQPPEPPAGVVGQKSEFVESGQACFEWFIKGTETRNVQPASTLSNFRITYPASGTIVALDPDIPEEQQQVFFESKPKDDRLKWKVDGKEVGRAGALLFWSPQKGMHTLNLVDDTNQVLDSVNFEVRGNLKAPNLPADNEVPQNGC
jgi:penicillin-binding protein 1C